MASVAAEQAAPKQQTASGAGETETDTVPILILSKCIIRPYRIADAAAMQKAADNPKVAQYMRNTFPSPYTLAAAERWIGIANTPVAVPDAALEAGSAPLILHFVLCARESSDDTVGVPCGGIGLKPGADVEARTMELGYWLTVTRWGTGIMTEAVGAFSAWAFARLPGSQRLEACTFSPNKASSRVLAKAGFVYEGARRRAGFKAGETFDMLIFGLLREECRGLQE